MSTFRVTETRQPVDINTRRFKNKKEALNCSENYVQINVQGELLYMPPFRQTCETFPAIGYKIYHIQNYYTDLRTSPRILILTGGVSIYL